MRKPIIAGNWKMNNTVKDTEALLTELQPLVKDAKCDVVVCVPFTDIVRAVELCKGTNIHVGAQNVAWADKGAFTGEISAAMLVEAGAEYVVLGHSERRQYFGETDETVNKRLTQAIRNGLKPILCVGETLAEREGNKTEGVLQVQLAGAFKDVEAKQAADVVIAYEPVWAIGTGKTATADQADEVNGYIRSVIAELYGKAAADAFVVQYGGSMNAKNADELLSKENVDGGLIGGASLKAEDFSIIVKAASK